MMGIVIALISGALMSIQGVFNTQVTDHTSIWVSSSWVQFSALIVCLAAWFFTGRPPFGGLFPRNRNICCLAVQSALLLRLR